MLARLVVRQADRARRKVGAVGAIGRRRRLRAKCPLCNAYVFKGFAPPPPPDTGDDDDDDVEMVELGERRDSE